jgi:hypothetical protein
MNNELMIHVERIVRPVRAMQSRKLRMRRELLAHLQAAYDEERAAGADEAIARDRASQRLGNPRELTQSLQQSVPWLERTLMMRVPGVSAVDRLEKHSEALWGLDRGATLLHSGIVLLGGATLGYFALLFAILVLSPKNLLASAIERPGAALLMNLFNIVAVIALSLSITHFMFAVTRRQRPRWHRLRMTLIVLLPMLVMTVAVATVERRAPRLGEFAECISIGVGLLLWTFAVAEIVRRLRRPYDPWLTLDIAE